jgi:hypothetical protein
MEGQGVADPKKNKKKTKTNVPNGHKIYQMVNLQDPPKYNQIGNFWFENTYTIWQPCNGRSKLFPHAI